MIMGGPTERNSVMIHSGSPVLIYFPWKFPQLPLLFLSPWFFKGNEVEWTSHQLRKPEL